MRGSPTRLALLGAFALAWASALAFVLATSDSGGAPPSQRARETARPVARTQVAQAPRPAAPAPTPTPTPPSDPEAYRPLPKPRPTLVEPKAGVRNSEPESDDSEPERERGEEQAAPRPESDEEIRAQLRQLKEYYASLPKQDSSSPISDSSRFELTAGEIDALSGWQSSVASVYFDYGGPLACGGRLRRDQFGVANKNLPCGTMVTFRYGGKALRVPVIDRGPYIKGREWDLTGATAIALNFPGLGPIDWTLD